MFETSAQPGKQVLTRFAPPTATWSISVKKNSNTPGFLASVVLLACSPSVATSDGNDSSPFTRGERASTTEEQGTSTGRPRPQTESSSGDSIGTTTSLSETATGATADGTSSSTGLAETELCPGNSRSNCSVAPSCGPLPCGHSDNVLDERGCPRPTCEDGTLCPDGMRCYAPTICSGVCAQAGIACEQSKGTEAQTCTCEGKSACAGGAYCLSENEWPGCCALDSDDPDNCPTPGR